MCIHSSELHLMKCRESMYLEDIITINETFSLSKPPPHTLSTVIICITKPLLSLGIHGLHELTNHSEICIPPKAQVQSQYPKILAERKVALNKQSALIDLPPRMDLTAAVIHNIPRYKNTESNTLSASSKIKNAHISRLVGTQGYGKNN